MWIASHLLFLSLVILSPAGESDDPSRLSGVVRDDSGQPIPEAWVFACPVNHRAGLGTSCAYLVGRPPKSADDYCPSCQPDRGPRTVTAADGTFAFSELDPEFEHFVVAGKAGFRPVLLGAKKLTAGEVIVLPPLDEERLAPERVHDGLVLLPDGRPAVGASVRCVGVDTPEGRLWMKHDADSMAVTDEEGRFRITTGGSERTIWVRVRSEGGTRAVRRLLHADSPHEIHLEVGSTLTGRVLLGAESPAGLHVGLVQVEHSPDRFLGDFRAVVDETGVFRFEDVPRGETYHLYGKMGELRGGAVIPGKRIEVEYGADRVEIGFLRPSPGLRIEGRVLVGEDGVPAPGTQVLVMRGDAWDVRPWPIAADGSFEISGVPAGPIELSLYAPGFRLSRRNPNRDPDDRFARVVTGRLEGDIRDLLIHLVAEDAPVEDAPELPPGHPGQRPFQSATRPPKKK